MKKLFKGLGLGLIVLALVVGVGASSTNAALTLGALTAVSDGALTITTAVGSAGNLFTTTTTGAINIGTAITTGVFTIGNASATGNTVVNGTVTTGTNSLYDNTTTANTTMFAGQTSGTLAIGGTAGTGAISIGTSTGAQTLNLATGNAVKTIVMGNATAGGASVTTIHAGTGGLNLGTTADARTISIGTGAAVQTINMATGAAAHVVTIGAANTTAAVTIYGQRFPVVAPAGDATLTTSQSGSLISMNTAGEDITLPTVATSSGVTYRFVVPSAVATTAMTIVTNGSENKIYGAVRAGAADGAVSGVNCTAASDTITLSISNETIGDWYELRSDGTNWYLTGSMADIAGATCTQAS